MYASKTAIWKANNLSENSTEINAISARIYYRFKSNLKESDMKKWECIVCGFIYEEALGLPDEGIAPGTAWEDIPAGWICPDCGVGKSDFEMVQI